MRLQQQELQRRRDRLRAEGYDADMYVGWNPGHLGRGHGRKTQQSLYSARAAPLKVSAGGDLESPEHR